LNPRAAAGCGGAEGRRLLNSAEGADDGRLQQPGGDAGEVHGAGEAGGALMLL